MIGRLAGHLMMSLYRLRPKWSRYTPAQESLYVPGHYVVHFGRGRVMTEQKFQCHSNLIKQLISLSYIGVFYPWEVRVDGKRVRWGSGPDWTVELSHRRTLHCPVRDDGASTGIDPLTKQTFILETHTIVYLYGYTAAIFFHTQSLRLIWMEVYSCRLGPGALLPRLGGSGHTCLSVTNAFALTTGDLAFGSDYATLLFTVPRYRIPSNSKTFWIQWIHTKACTFFWSDLPQSTIHQGSLYHCNL